MTSGTRIVLAAVLLAALPAATCPAAPARVEFSRDFAPAEGWVKSVEQPFRQDLCLNGRWQFQPVPLPAGWKRGTGIAPDLPMPAADKWDSAPIKIPSPWNVNTWGAGRDVGEGSPHPYWPSSVYYPSYPAAWDGVEMAWLRRTFRVPADWADRRIVLHFEAVGGHAQVLVNGKKAGEHFDRYLPFELDVTDLVQRGAENELLVGVRSMRLFDLKSEKYPHMRTPYPPGSNTDNLSGIWQDVFLLGLPPVRVADVFVKPLVDSGTLEAEVTLRNDLGSDVTVDVGGSVQPWVNMAGASVLDAPEPKWRLDEPAMALPPQRVTLEAGETKTVTLSEKVAGRLKLWSPDAPNLYGLVLTVDTGGRTLDRSYTRFGWRECKIAGKNFVLNGQPLKMTGDLLHPFGPFINSRRYVWAWYRMIKDMGGNAVRPHAQPHPRHYLDLADEMGLLVLDETALFGSSISLNFEAPAAWQRFAEHYDGLVLRDRNHPAVCGWSFGNELFAIFNLNNVPNDAADGWYKQLAELGLRALRLDPTRPWISCDGDEDLRGTMPVWSKHFGHGTPLDRLPDGDKPLMVGESGGTYYARPKQMAEFNGPRAYESYAGRNEALAIDVYDNIVRMARPRLAYYSASETAWFGLEHLAYGYSDFSRLPGKEDGVFFAKAFEEGKPGIQPERLPPYVATLNPGWDPSLPLYKPLAMFHAEKTALAKDGPLPCPWDHKAKPAVPAAPVPATLPPTIEKVAFIGQRTAALGRRLAALGVPLSDGAQGFTIVDADSLSDAALAQQAKTALDTARTGSGTVLVMMGASAAPADLLPAPVRLTDHPATALVPDATHPWTAPLALPDLYFAEDGNERFIMRRGLDGPVLDGARVLLRASNTDWSLFNNAPEHSKCAALVLYEHMEKPSGAALVERAHGSGKLVLCSLDYRVGSRAADTFWRRLLAGMGLKLGRPADAVQPAFDEAGTLLNALAVGRFAAPSADAALATDFVGDATVRPVAGDKAGALVWQPVNCPSLDRFVFQEMREAGPEAEPFAVYFSYWIRSPRALDDLLADGPDAPRFSTVFYVSEKCRLLVNDREVKATATEPADYRTRLTFENIPLKKGWNHFLVKVAARQLRGENPATLAVRIRASREEYFRQIESAVELKSTPAK